MGRFERERDFQAAAEAALSSAMPDIDVRDVELNEPQELVRVFVDRPGGVTLDVCADVTKVLRSLTDLALEVSSPGERPPLRHPRHFAAVCGERARFRRSGDRRAFVARILDVDADAVTVERGDGTTETLSYGSIVRSHLEPGQASTATDPDPSANAKGRT